MVLEQLNAQVLVQVEVIKHYIYLIKYVDNETLLNNHYGSGFIYTYVEAVYNYQDPLNPIHYILQAGKQILFDPESLDSFRFNFVRNELHDIDGRVRFY